MLSGEWSYVPLSSITINRGERVRKVITEEAIGSLADSIRRGGLLHPPVITREYVLVAGETRLEALRSLGYDSIPIQWADTLDERELLAIELEENVKRTDLSWQEQCDAVTRFHDLQVQLRDSWTLSDTSVALGMSERSVKSYRAVAKEIASGNTKVAAAAEFSTARNIVQRTNERRTSDAKGVVDTVMQAPKPASPILVADFNEWAPQYSGPPFNFIHCDFPYGIDMDKSDQAEGSRGVHGDYSDTADDYKKLIDTLIFSRERLMGESAHLLFWFSMRYYAYTLERLKEFLWVDPYPLVWHKSDGKGLLPDPSRGPRRIYETAFFCSYGDRKIISSVSNTFAAPVGERIHMSEKPQAMLEHFFRMTCDAGTRFLDPTCGSASSLRAARALGAGSVLGLELNEEFASAARKAFEA